MTDKDGDYLVKQVKYYEDVITFEILINFDTYQPVQSEGNTLNTLPSNYALFLFLSRFFIFFKMLTAINFCFQIFLVNSILLNII